MQPMTDDDCSVLCKCNRCHRMPLQNGRAWPRKSTTVFYLSQWYIVCIVYLWDKGFATLTLRVKWLAVALREEVKMKDGSGRWKWRWKLWKDNQVSVKTFPYWRRRQCTHPCSEKKTKSFLQRGGDVERRGFFMWIGLQKQTTYIPFTSSLWNISLIGP